MKQPNAHDFPLMSIYDANITYQRAKGARSQIFARSTDFYAAEPALCTAALQSAILGKRKKAIDYERACVPLWLLLTVNDPIHDGILVDDVFDGLKRTGVGPLGRFIRTGSARIRW